MAINQLSIFAENRPGALVEITSLLGDAGIDLRAMSIADTEDYGILRLIVSDLAAAQTVLQGAGLVFHVTPVVGVAVSDKPGALAGAMRALFDGGINVEYLYAFINSDRQHACVVMRVADNERAEEILLKQGLSLLSEGGIDNA